MTLDEIPKEAMSDVGDAIKRICEGLGKAADEILTHSMSLAHKNQELSALKDDQALTEAKIRVKVSTAINEETRKAYYPNIDSQNAQILIETSEDDSYVNNELILLDTQLAIEMLKAKLTRLHEKRKDIGVEKEMILVIGSVSWIGDGA